MGEEPIKPSPQVAFGRRVYAARLALAKAEGKSRITQGELAKRVGLRQQDISDIEKGVNERIVIAHVAPLAEGLNVDLHELFTGEQRAPVSKLANDISRLKMDHWGEAAVLDVARQEAKRYREQEVTRQAEAQADPVVILEQTLLRMGYDPESARQVAQRVQDSADDPTGAAPSTRRSRRASA